MNSIVWTNSSVVALNGGVRPAAMFLHGASPRTTGDGRHIHALNATDYYAEKQFAGSVRCVRDVKKTFLKAIKFHNQLVFHQQWEVKLRSKYILSMIHGEL